MVSFQSGVGVEFLRALSAGAAVAPRSKAARATTLRAGRIMLVSL